MTLALGSPHLVRDLVAVDNAPVDTAIGREFGRYIQGMIKIDEAAVTRQADADKILQDYEEVATRRIPSFPSAFFSSFSYFLP